MIIKKVPLRAAQTSQNSPGYTLDNAAIGQNLINASSISNFNLNLGGVSLVAGESPASGSVNFSLPFTGGIADFDFTQFETALYCALL